MTDKRTRYLTAARNALLYADLAHVLRVLSDAGVPVVVLKGAALAKTVYPDIAHRPMGDVDLLVYPRDRDRARETLETAGYRFMPEPVEPLHPFATVFTGEVAFCRENGIFIELHWELTPVEWLRRLIALDTEALWQDAQPLDLGGVSALQLAPYDLLLHLCLHLAAHNYAHPVGYRDILQVLNYYQPFPWDAFLERAKWFRLRTACYFALEAVAKKGSSSRPFTSSLSSHEPDLIPTEVLYALQPPRWRRWLVRIIADPCRGMTGELPYTRPRSYLLHLAIADRPLDVLRVGLWLLFPGPRWLAERYRLRGRFSPWLACLWHPMVILWQGLLALREIF